MKKGYLILLILFLTINLSAQDKNRFSTAGFYELPNTGREVFSMNLAWRFIKSDVEGTPYDVDFNDSDWETVSIPHGLELLPIEASGSTNYQGVAWYRKRFTADSNLQGRQLFLHFEAIMGKSDVYINGKLVKQNFGGYLPVIVDVTNVLKWDEENIIAVKTDNSDDTSYPVGKAQNLLDFTYFGGIYRDCWLIAHNDIFITNSNYENEIAGGGLFVSFNNVSEESATINLKTHIRNSSSTKEKVAVSYELKDIDENIINKSEELVSIKSNKSLHTTSSINVKTPNLWSPDNPYLYYLDVLIKDDKGKVIDGYRQRIGIRSIEFKQTDGLWINGKPYEGKIMGTNRHQDFAIVGNALPNSMQWRDAKKLRDAGLKVIRTHYIIDPAFMDACDELGLFALVEVPGWQFWNDDPVFEDRVYSDIRNMIRIHRNHASLFFWEPVLNETHYPESFAKKSLKICEEEYPYPYSIAACDDGANGDEHYSLLLRPIEANLRTDKTYFIREWGDNVDDWNSQNSDSRVARNWGEVPMLIQAEHYANPSYIDEYPILCYETICNKPSQIVGAAFWHSFDHQRGYHADPFFGGIMDAFRQPKTSYYMFMSQRSSQESGIIADNGPMIHIAHEITPFSPKDITVYSNCDEVKLTIFEGGKQLVYKKDKKHKGMPSPIITFNNAYNFMEWKTMAREWKQDKAYLLAEGLIDGKVVATHKRYPSGQVDKILLRADDEGVKLKADGSDIITNIAEIVDKRGTVKRLNNSEIIFRIEGEGRIVGDNTQTINWGSAPILIQSTPKQGKIKIIASMKNPGKVRPIEGKIEIESMLNDQREIFSEKELNKPSVYTESTQIMINKSDLEKENELLRRELNQLKVKEVEKQQTEFGKGIND